MNETILVIEDEKNISDILKYSLQKEGYNAICAYNGGNGYKLVGTNKPAVVLLDVMLPDINGITICQMICDNYDIPVIMLTALGNVTDKLEGLAAGADDYITKPFDIREVIARIKVVLKRSKSNKKDMVVEVDNVRIEYDKYKVYMNEELVELTPKEFELLAYLVKHPDIVFNRDMLLEEIWGYEYCGDTRTIDTHIQRLRKKLNWMDRITTVYGVGYKFIG